MVNKILAICADCNKTYYTGENCKCSKNDDIAIAKYAQAMQSAIKCWSDANCDEHQTPCKPTVKEFAITIFELNKKIELLENAIKSHKQLNNNPDENDNRLYGLI
jgi:hypothetical protein